MICVLRSFKVNSGFIQNASKFSSLIRAPADNKNRKSPLLFNGPCRRARRNFSASGTSSAESQRIVKMALAGNMAITVAKAACWMGTGSSGQPGLAARGVAESRECCRPPTPLYVNNHISPALVCVLDTELAIHIFVVLYGMCCLSGAL